MKWLDPNSKSKLQHLPITQLSKLQLEKVNQKTQAWNTQDLSRIL